MFKLKIIKLLTLSVVLATSAYAAEEEGGLYFSIEHNEDKTAYVVSAIPTAVPDVDISLSGQVTLKVPHGTESEQFIVAALNSHVEGYRWIESSRANAPEEAPDFDYVSFSFVPESQARYPFDWEVDKAKPLFSFSNSGKCLGDISLLSDTDPFNVPLNSLSTNPGNHFTNLGWGNINRNHYLGNKEEMVPCLP